MYVQSAVLPLYTRFLSPAEYGLIALLEVVALVLGSIFSLGMPEMMRFYYTEPLVPARRRRDGAGRRGSPRKLA